MNTLRTLTVSNRSAGVAQVTMSRPAVFNAFDEAMIAELADVFTRLAQDASVRVIVGLVQRVVDADVLDAAVDATVADLLAGGPNAQSEIKQLFAQLEAGPITSEVRELTARTISRVRGTGEAQEGFAAFLTKRPANWIPS